MKKLIPFTIIMIISMMIFVPTSHAGKKRVKRAKRPSYKRFAYDSIWFAHMSQKQKKVYVTEMKKLTDYMARRGVSNLDQNFLKWIVPEAVAAGEFINNGFVYIGSNDDSDYDTFLGTLGILDTDIDPKCSAGEKLCAPQMGMICEGENFKLACSPNSTPTCSSRGKADCLVKALDSCNLDKSGSVQAGKTLGTSGFCQGLDKSMKAGTLPIGNYCGSTTRFRTACNAAENSLREAGIVESPTDAPAPTGADCEQMTRELMAAKDENRGGGGKPEEGAANANFWRNITGFANQACGHRTVTSNKDGNGTMDILGQCTQDAGPPNLTPQRSEVKTYKRTDDGFAACVAEKREKAENEQRSLSTSAQSTMTGAALSTRLEELNTQFARRFEYIRNLPECTRSETSTPRRGDGSIVKEFSLDTLMPLAQKIKSNTKLTESEENQFRAATGLRSDKFKSAFCSPKNFSDFQQALGSALAYNSDIIGTSELYEGWQDRRDVAAYKMAVCKNNLKPVSGEGGTGCKLKVVNDFNLLRCADKNFPILSQNIANNSCVLVTGFDRSVTARDDAGRSLSQEARITVRAPNISEKQVPIKSESYYYKDNRLRVYVCDGDRPPNYDCYMRPRDERPEHAGEAEAAI